jgi:hypothetical protein
MLASAASLNFCKQKLTCAETRDKPAAQAGLQPCGGAERHRFVGVLAAQATDSPLGLSATHLLPRGARPPYPCAPK